MIIVSTNATFQQRVREIELYYTFVESYVSNPPSGVNSDLIKILKSNLLLMLYNLVESSMTNALEEMHEGMHASSISFDSLKDSIKKNLITTLKNHIGSDDFIRSVRRIALDIVKTCFKKDKVFSGNVDAMKIRDYGSVYGFSTMTTYLQTKNGNCLKDIKDCRNDLAHGIFSFTEVGHKYDVLDLKNYKEEAIQFLSQILDNIDSYMQNQEYLTPPVTVPISI